MKNIFKLVSVFMALALVFSTLLFSGVFASAEPDWQLVWSGAIDTEIVQAADGTATLGVAALDEAVAAELANYDATKFKVESNATFTSGDGAYACWSFFVPNNGAQLWSAVVNDAPSTEITSSVDVEITDIDETWKFGIVGEGGSGTFVATEFALYAYREAGSTEPEETGAEPEETGAESTVTEAQPTATATATVTEAEPSVTEAEPTATETEPSATETEPTEPVTLVETVLVENNVGGAKVLKPEKTDAWFLQVDEIKADIAANGPIDPSKGEYYQIIVTGYVDNGEADFHLGEGLNWEEYWGESGSVTTESSTVVATIPVAIPAEGIGAVYLADSGEAGHTLTWTYAKVSVFRVGEPTEPTEESTESQPTATNPTAVVYGDANGDNAVNMKDVLLVRKYIAGIEVKLDMTASDVNLDGAVNMKDVLQLRKFLAGLITELGV